MKNEKRPLIRYGIPQGDNITDNSALLSFSKVFFMEKNMEKVIMDAQMMSRTLARLSHEIIEKNVGNEEIFLVGIRRRGVPLSKLLKANIEKFSDMKVGLGELDITLYRDDLSEKYNQPHINNSIIDFDVNGKRIILVDDVIYTGRTTRAAMDALISLGRPAAIQLCVMVDRGHRELPVCANFVGKNLPTSREEFVSVRVDEVDGKTEVVIAKP